MTSPTAIIETTTRNTDDPDTWDVTVTIEDADNAGSLTFEGVAAKTLSKWMRKGTLEVKLG